MSDAVYIVVPRWDGPDGFQHYRDRDPIWIKNYTRLLSDDGYMKLSLHQRGILHGIWLEYARSNRQLPGDTLTLTRRLGHRVTTRDVEALNHAGFIQLSASAPLATCYPSRAPAHSPEPEPEIETEEEPDQKPGRTTPAPAQRTDQQANRNHAGLDTQTELELAQLLEWIGDDADSRTAAVVRHNWTNAPEAARLAVNQSRKTSRPRHRAKWLVATIKAETDRARGLAA